jgi:hypothetical protein
MGAFMDHLWHFIGVVLAQISHQSSKHDPPVAGCMALISLSMKRP